MASVKDAIASMARNIEQQTGKSVAMWTKLSQKEGLHRHGEIVKWLKTTHGLSHGYANFLALQATGSGHAAQADDDLVAAQYSGAKAALKPLYDKVVALVLGLGPDVELAPKKSNVSVRRHKQFALLQPSSATRLDIGLVLKGVAPTTRLEASGSFNAMFTHRVRVTSLRDIDAELRAWLARAYETN